MALQQGPTAEELVLVRQSAREALTMLYPGSPDEGWPQSWTAAWPALDEQGLWSTIEPPDGSLATAAVVVEELGRALFPGPACEALTAAYVLGRLGPDAIAPFGGCPAAAFAVESGVLVEVAPETLLVVATAHRGLAAAKAAELDTSAVPSLDVTRQIVHLSLRGAPPAVPSSGDLAAYGRAARALMYCADTLGCVEHVLEQATEYARQRTTFGSPIGKYQAVAHRLVDHAVTARQIRLLLESATAAFDGQSADLARQVALTETFVHGHSADIVSSCIQLAGAIGFTWEFGYHFYLRRVVQNCALGGAPGRPQQRLAQEAAW